MPAELIMTNDEIYADWDGWLERRRQGVTASEMAAVTGLAPPGWGSPFELYHAKIEGWVSETTEAYEWGHFAEPWIAERFQRAHPELHVGDGGLYRSSDRPWQMATYDRLAYEAGAAGDLQGDTALGAVQLKTAAWLDPEEGWGEPGSAAIPLHYRIQVLTEMDVGDYSVGWLPVMNNQHKVVTYVVHRDAEAEADIVYLREAGEEFLARLADRRPPEIDWTPATTRALKRLHPGLEDREAVIPLTVARRYKRAIAAQKRAEQRKSECVNQILARMAGAKYAVIAGLEDKGKPVRLCTRTVYEQGEYTVPARKVDKLQPGKWTP